MVRLQEKNVSGERHQFDGRGQKMVPKTLGMIYGDCRFEEVRMETPKGIPLYQNVPGSGKENRD